jgi:hypothetical protein
MEHIEEVSTSIRSEGDDNNKWGIQQTPELSSNICKVTCVGGLPEKFG